MLFFNQISKKLLFHKETKAIKVVQRKLSTHEFILYLVYLCSLFFFNNEVSIYLYNSFFLCYCTQYLQFSLSSYKLTGKLIDITKTNFINGCYNSSVSIIKLQIRLKQLYHFKQFQYGSSVTEVKKNLENIYGCCEKEIYFLYMWTIKE